GGGAGRLAVARRGVAVDVRTGRARRARIAVGQHRGADRAGHAVGPRVLLVGPAVHLGARVGLATAARRLARAGTGARALRTRRDPAPATRSARAAGAGAAGPAVQRHRGV